MSPIFFVSCFLAFLLQHVLSAPFSSEKPAKLTLHKHHNTPAQNLQRRRILPGAVSPEEEAPPLAVGKEVQVGYQHGSGKQKHIIFFGLLLMYQGQGTMDQSP